MATETSSFPALTMLTEEEAMFRDAIRDFAQNEIAPKAREMEKDGRYDPAVLHSLGLTYYAIGRGHSFAGA